MNKVIHGDCLTEAEQIASGSVDLILTDLPYGTMEGQSRTGIYHQGDERHEWDERIPSADIHQIANRILRKNGKMVLFAQGEILFELYNTAIPNLPYSYKMLWQKETLGSFMRSKKAPLYQTEDILVFSGNDKRNDRQSRNPLRKYFNEIYVAVGRELLVKLFVNEGRYKTKESAAANVALKFGQNKANFEFMTKSLYDYLRQKIKFDMEYAELCLMQREFDEMYPSTFNLWEGKKYKSNILKYAKDYDGYHPTQKPVLLLEDLIKTFSNEGDLVVDLTAGSGTTAIACINTNRNYILIEKEKEYIDTINKRIAEHEQQLTII